MSEYASTAPSHTCSHHQSAAHFKRHDCPVPSQVLTSLEPSPLQAHQVSAHLHAATQGRPPHHVQLHHAAAQMPCGL